MANNPQISQQQLVQLVMNDPLLSISEKAELVDKLRDANYYQSLVHGAIGAGLGLAFSRYMELSRTAQVLISLAGFGIGKYLLDVSSKHDKFLQYNDKYKTYTINS